MSKIYGMQIRKTLEYLAAKLSDDHKSIRIFSSHPLSKNHIISLKYQNNEYMLMYQESETGEDGNLLIHSLSEKPVYPGALSRLQNILGVYSFIHISSKNPYSFSEDISIEEGYKKNISSKDLARIVRGY